jgi:hypothetical protein
MVGGYIMDITAYETLQKFANEQRRSGESEAQAFARYCRTPEGAKLLRKHQQERLADSYSYLPAAETARVEKSALAQSDWNALVAGIQGMAKCSLSKAIDAALGTEAGREAFKVHKRAEMMASRQYTQADMITHDSVEAVRQYNYDMRKANTKPLFMQMVDDVRSRNPSMSMTAAMDHVRSIKPEGEEAWQKFKTLGLANDPQDGALSGRPDPSRAPMWEGEQTSSHLTQPRKFPVADDTPTFKSATEQWSDLVGEFRKSTGWDWARTVNALKHHELSAPYYSAMCRENMPAA